jgi:hypothetical protein
MGLADKLSAFEATQTKPQGSLADRLSAFEKSQSASMPQAQEANEPSFASFLPFGATGERLAQGKGFGYDEGAEGASRAAGDIATGAGAIGAGAAAGAAGAPIAPVLGAGLAGAGLAGLVGYGAEKMGITPALKSASEKMRQDLLPKILTEPQTQSVPANFALQLLGMATPVGQASLALESLPLAAQFAAGAKGAKMGAGAINRLGQMAEAKVPQAVLDLEKYGGKPTPAASGGALAKTLEFSARSNPLMQMIDNLGFKGADEANMAAAQKFAEGKFGSDIKMGVRPAIGETMRGLLNELAGRRAAKYEPAVEALSQAKGFPNYSNTLLKAVEGAAESLNVTGSAKKAFLSAAKESLKGANTPMKVDKALTDIRIKFADKLKGVTDKRALDQLDRDFGSMSQALKRANYDALNKIQPGLGDEIAQAKGEYAGASQVIAPMAKVMKARGQKPEAIMGDILNQGSEGIKAMMAELTPSEKVAFQKDFARFILEESKKGDKGPSAATIKTMLGGRYKDIAPVIGGEGITNLTRLAEMMEAAKLGELYSQNPSGSGSTIAKFGQLGALFDPTFTAQGPMLAKTAFIDAPYALAGGPVMKALGATKKTVGKLAGGGKKPNLPPDLLRALSVMNAAPAAIAR